MTFITETVTKRLHYALILNIAFFIFSSEDIQGACPSCGKKTANSPGLHVTYVSAKPSYMVMSFSSIY